MKLFKTINVKTQQVSYSLAWKRLLMSLAKRMNTCETMFINDNS